MVIKNNMNAKNSLNSLNKNSKALAKSLTKVSSGMKINSASDDASGFSISEKMRVQIRSLDQAVNNSQNASSLLKVADGALTDTVDILRTMKEKAINAANDSNTNADRAIIQKEIDQLIAQINDNSDIRFNNKVIFDGAMNKTYNDEQTIVAALNTEWISNALTLTEQSMGLNFSNAKGSKSLEIYFMDDPSAGFSSQLAYHANSANRNVRLALNINMNSFKGISDEDVNGKSAALTHMDREITEQIAGAVMFANIDGCGNLPNTFLYGAQRLICGIDDTNKANILSFADSVGGFSEVSSYEAGYVAFRYMAAKSGYSAEESLKQFMGALASSEGEMTTERVNSAIQAASKGWIKDFNHLRSCMVADRATAGSGDKFLKQYCDINLDNKDTGSIIGFDAGVSREEKTADSAVPEGGSTKYWHNPLTKSTYIEGLEVKWCGDWQTLLADKRYLADIQVKGGMRFHTGTEASQNITINMPYIDAKAIGVQDKNNKNLSVKTLTQASNAITQLDKSIDCVLDYITYIGAASSRMEYTISNLTVSGENTTAAESVIRDADMAKEMTEYTKNNVLMQAAQSMLAQSNQSSSQALSLLQG